MPDVAADVLTYMYCTTLHCVPSDLDDEDSGVLERLMLVHKVVKQLEAAEMEKMSKRRG